MKSHQRIISKMYACISPITLSIKIVAILFLIKRVSRKEILDINVA